jgi:hypothetical protein
LPDFYEIDFHPVQTSKSGDAITMRYQIGQHWWVGVVDGGYINTAPDIASHIRNIYGTTRINHVVVIHPDKDHAEGLAPILEEFTVDQLLMLRPWRYAADLLPHFARYRSVQNLVDRLKEEYPYIAHLENIATRRGILISEPFQGQKIGPYIVLAPSLGRYLQLIIDSDKTPQQAADSHGVIAGLLSLVKPVTNFIREGWGAERFSSEETSIENEMSVV